MLAVIEPAHLMYCLLYPPETMKSRIKPHKNICVPVDNGTTEVGLRSI